MEEKKIQKRGRKLPVVTNEEKKRYNETEATKGFLISEKGLKFLTNIARNRRFGKSELVKEIDNLIDVYSTWTVSFPVRKNLKVSKYDFLKSVEDFCLKKENSESFEFLFSNNP